MKKLTADCVKWEILGDLVDEDWAMVWEHVSGLRHEFPDHSDADRSAAAGAAIRELLADGWIYVFRREGSSLEDGPRLSFDEVDELLRGEAWRTLPVADEVMNVWLAPTDAGVDAARRRWPELFKRE